MSKHGSNYNEQFTAEAEAPHLKPYRLKAEAKVKKFTDQLINSRKTPCTTTNTSADYSMLT